MLVSYGTPKARIVVHFILATRCNTKVRPQHLTPSLSSIYRKKCVESNATEYCIVLVYILARWQGILTKSHVKYACKSQVLSSESSRVTLASRTYTLNHIPRKTATLLGYQSQDPAIYSSPHRWVPGRHIALAYTAREREKKASARMAVTAWAICYVLGRRETDSCPELSTSPSPQVCISTSITSVLHNIMLRFQTSHYSH